MRTNVFLSALAATALFAVPAQALTLTNEDAATYEVEVVQGQGGQSADMMELEAEQSLEGLCEDGCTLRLNTGAEQDFAGDENVIIRDGAFVIAE